MSDPNILNYFAFEHLPPHLRDVSQPFAALVEDVLLPLFRTTTDKEEAGAALRKLLEAKDAAVRARLGADHEAFKAARPAVSDDVAYLLDLVVWMSSALGPVSAETYQRHLKGRLGQLLAHPMPPEDAPGHV